MELEPLGSNTVLVLKDTLVSSVKTVSRDIATILLEVDHLLNVFPAIAMVMLTFVTTTRVCLSILLFKFSLTKEFHAH
jgi:hypothetical protein